MCQPYIESIYLSLFLTLFLPRFLISIFHTLPALDCRTAPVLLNGSVATQNGTLVGSKAIYTCNSKFAFTVDSSMERTCKSSGEWSTERIECGEFWKRSVYFQIMNIIVHVVS